MSTPRVDALKSLLTDQPKNPLRHAQREDREAELRRLEAVVGAPDWQTGPAKGRARESYRKVKQSYESQIAKPTPHPDQVQRLVEEVMEQEIRPTLLPDAVMRSNPAGAVDAFRKGEGSPQTKDAILTWKRGMRALDPENADQDYTNVERFRPKAGREGYPQFDAQIARAFAPGASPSARETLTQVFDQGQVNSPLNQAKRREQKPATGQKRQPLTEAQKAVARGNAAKARAAKAAKQAQRL